MVCIRRYVCLFLVVLQLLHAADELKPDLTVMIPMRDGVVLPTDLYLPSPEAKGLPCILLRSPAGRESAYWKSFAEMSKAGYVIAIQDTRNVLDTEGKTFPFISDGWGKLQDGYDTVEWLASSPYTNGKIGTWGSSALGITQLLMAPSNPPHLQCQYIIVAAASLYHHGIFPGGVLLKNQAEGWLGFYARDTGVLNYVCQRPFYNEFWKQLNALEVSHRVHVPGMHVGGWYDTFLQGTLSAFASRQNEGGKGAKGQQKLVVGPWTHYWPVSKQFGDFEVPAAGVSPPFDISPKRWFDYYLKGMHNGIEHLPPVTYYVMGPFDGEESSGNVWRTSNIWPVPSKATPYYLNSYEGLQLQVPFTGILSYTYDPRNPIETNGGRNLFLPSGPTNQASIEERDDILVFTSEPLEEDIEVTGNLSAKLFFASDQKDTDLVIRLCDVYPDGRSILISEGSYRLGVMCFQSEQPQELKPNQPIPITIDLWATSIVFAKGHSIRLSISSSSYPRYEKNMNVGLIGGNTGKFKVAKNMLYVGEKFPSYLLLPIVRKGNTWLVEDQSASLTVDKS
ncbi:CocE/NonD family hydrolase [Candidatus Protochlamydia phocaeensis]|uniref:CocE/NonD family hydrolase n=1 Tax=Candidatus Protochlamydia phocaeensis TaxID=1414722 RepID=UPI0008380827|nr:CocE/NonD family hydrolase [Candidatus Protochlamydia phocaeensis]